jgi:hypothetical protein
MLFFRIFDFVVADAVEALDEHHDGEDAEAGDFGGVGEGAGGEAMWNGAGLGDGFVAQGDDIGVERLAVWRRAIY